MESEKSSTQNRCSTKKRDLASHTAKHGKDSRQPTWLTHWVPVEDNENNLERVLATGSLDVLVKQASKLAPNS